MLELEIREWVARYLAQEVTLREFEHWFVPATWQTQADVPVGELASQIRTNLVELSGKEITQDRLRELWLPLVTRYHLSDDQIPSGAFQSDAEPVVSLGYDVESVADQPVLSGT